MKMTPPKAEHFRFQSAIQPCKDISLHSDVQFSFQVKNSRVVEMFCSVSS